MRRWKIGGKYIALGELPTCGNVPKVLVFC